MINFNKLMNQAKELQEKLGKEIEDLVVEATVGGGMVKVEMNGKKEVVKVTIDPEAIDPDDMEVLEDLVTAAVNECGRKVNEAISGQMGGLAGQLGIGNLPL